MDDNDRAQIEEWVEKVEAICDAMRYLVGQMDDFEPAGEDDSNTSEVIHAVFDLKLALGAAYDELYFAANGVEHCLPA